MNKIHVQKIKRKRRWGYQKTEEPKHARRLHKHDEQDGDGSAVHVQEIRYVLAPL